MFYVGMACMIQRRIKDLSIPQNATYLAICCFNRVIIIYSIYLGTYFIDTVEDTVNDNVTQSKTHESNYKYDTYSQ